MKAKQSQAAALFLAPLSKTARTLAALQDKLAADPSAAAAPAEAAPAAEAPAEEVVAEATAESAPTEDTAAVAETTEG